jgi:hypothetical protein
MWARRMAQAAVAASRCALDSGLQAGPSCAGIELAAAASPARARYCSPPAPETPREASGAKAGPTPRRLPPWANNSPTRSSQRLPSGAQPPWVPTSQLTKRKTYPKRMRHMLSELRGEYQAGLSEDRGAHRVPQPGEVITVDIVRSSCLLRHAPRTLHSATAWLWRVSCACTEQLRGTSASTLAVRSRLQSELRVHCNRFRLVQAAPKVTAAPERFLALPYRQRLADVQTLSVQVVPDKTCAPQRSPAL